MFGGYLTRGSYAVRVFAAGLIAGASQMIAFDEYDQPTSYIGLHVVIVLVTMVAMANFVVKRLHDLGRPGAHYWFSYIPLYNIYFGLQLLFCAGVARPIQSAVESTPKSAVRDYYDADPGPSTGRLMFVYCGHCGVESPNSAKFCWQCGQVLYGAIRGTADGPQHGAQVADKLPLPGPLEWSRVAANQPMDHSTNPDASTASQPVTLASADLPQQRGAEHVDAYRRYSGDHRAPSQHVDGGDSGADGKWILAMFISLILVVVVAKLIDAR